MFVDLPGGSLDVTVFNGSAEIRWGVGTYRNDIGSHFYNQNFYDYAEMFEGNMTNCAYENEACPWDASKQCLTMTCGKTAIDCPPAQLPPCPGYTYDPCKHQSAAPSGRTTDPISRRRRGRRRPLPTPRRSSTRRARQTPGRVAAPPRAPRGYSEAGSPGARADRPGLERTTPA